jgi:phenylalanyl-tRNA synthetase beta chain
VTYSFVDGAAARLFGGSDATRLANPISADLSHLRPSLLPGLLRAVARNQARGTGDVALFEVGAVFDGGAPGQQRPCIAGVLAGRTGPKDVHGDARAVDLYDVKADAEAVLAAIGAPARMQIARGGAEWWHPGRHGRLCLGPKVTMGTFGEVHPRVLAALGLRGAAMGFEVWPDAVPAARATGTARPPLTISDLQAVERDFAFVVGAQVEAAAVVAAAAGADKRLIAEVRVFDQFALGEGLKSLAVTVRLQPVDATLTDAEIEAASAAVVAKVVKATGGTLRG